MFRLIYEVKAEGTERRLFDGPRNDSSRRVNLDTTCFAGNGTMTQKEFDQMVRKAKESSNELYRRRERRDL